MVGKRVPELRTVRAIGVTQGTTDQSDALIPFFWALRRTQLRKNIGVRFVAALAPPGQQHQHHLHHPHQRLPRMRMMQVMLGMLPMLVKDHLEMKENT